MKIASTLALIPAALGLIAPQVNAQSVTLYGVVDSGLSYMTTNTGNRTSLVSGGLSSNRWGIRGSEDLGDGLQAVFRLENGFSIVNGKLGQGGRQFGRQSVVGLASQRWGTVIFGRMYDPVVDMTEVLTAETIGGSPFATPGDVDNNDGSARVSNAVKYTSPVIAGLRAEAMYALGGIAGQNGQGYTAAGAVSYTYESLSVAGGYYQASNTHMGSTLRLGWSGASSDSLFDGGSINAAYATAHVIGIAQVATQYTGKRVSFGFGYSNATYRPDALSSFSRTETYNTARAFTFYRVNPMLQFGLGYAYTHASGDTSASYHQFSAGSFYNLSVRTDVYLTGAYQIAKGAQRTADGGTQRAVASISSYGVDGTRWQALALVGMRHRF
ncbi:porin [Paraburkholderia sp. MM6662-R1]|uniref:porin n=1 Tax=Paraburkholderia sp. MM6662-R1 TaxID=2991066 RepID=UPI003D209BEE